MSKQLVARGNYSYGGNRLRVGDEFTATDRDAKLLMAVGQATEKVEAKKTKPKKAEVAPSTGRYSRRDMRADA